MIFLDAGSPSASEHWEDGYERGELNTPTSSAINQKLLPTPKREVSAPLQTISPGDLPSITPTTDKLLHENPWATDYL